MNGLKFQPCQKKNSRMMAYTLGVVLAVPCIAGFQAADQQGAADIGVVVSSSQSCFQVARTATNYPANLSGIKCGDLLLRIGDTDTTNLDITQVIGLLRGDTGTSVNITIGREGNSELKSLDVTRRTRLGLGVAEWVPALENPVIAKGDLIPYVEQFLGIPSGGYKYENEETRHYSRGWVQFQEGRVGKWSIKSDREMRGAVDFVRVGTPSSPPPRTLADQRRQAVQQKEREEVQRVEALRRRDEELQKDKEEQNEYAKKVVGHLEAFILNNRLTIADSDLLRQEFASSVRLKEAITPTVVEWARDPYHWREQNSSRSLMAYLDSSKPIVQSLQYTLTRHEARWREAEARRMAEAEAERQRYLKQLEFMLLNNMNRSPTDRKLDQLQSDINQMKFQQMNHQ
jgi:hypothetical protein